MHMLAIETSTDVCSIAVLTSNKIIFDQAEEPKTHSHKILPMCEKLFSTANIQPSILTAIAYGKGPGSYTGVRVAASVAHGIALAHEIPIIPISSLAAMAQSVIEATRSKSILVAIDAKMGQIYWGAYTGDSHKMFAIEDEKVGTPEDFLSWCKSNIDNTWCAAGNAWTIYNDKLHVIDIKKDKKILSALFHPDAKNILKLACRQYDAGDFSSLEDALPIYLRNDMFKKNR